MKIIIFDTETTGGSNPILRELAWMEVRGNQILETRHYQLGRHNRIRYKIPPVVQFAAIVSQADLLVGHNVKYDIEQVNQELRRLKKKPLKPKVWTLDTMKEPKIMEYVGLHTDFNYEYKYPSLDELHTRLFGVKPVGRLAMDGKHTA
ncbi:MAG: hypothetical protein AAF740_10295, partial [Bacteroidota bacterium]